MKLLSLSITLLLSVTVTAACARTAPPPVAEPEARTVATPVPPSSAPATSGRATTPAANAALPLVLVHKSASCGCCALWVDHMRNAGFPVEVRNSDNLNPIKERVGVPLGQGSCHTAEVSGYFVEGHVPAEDVKRLLTQKPDAKGLVLPGMPAGSPGMEMPDGRVDAYTVKLVNRDGSATAFSQHGN